MAADLSALAKWRGAIGTAGIERFAHDIAFSFRFDNTYASAGLEALFDREIRRVVALQAGHEQGAFSSEEYIHKYGAFIGGQCTLAADAPHDRR